MEPLLLTLRLLLAGLLYLFLVTLFVLLWKELRAESRAVAGDYQPHGRLVVVEAAEGVLSPGTRFPLQSVTSLGRSQVNTIVIPDAYASAEHALLIWRDGQWWLEDRGSRNGTLLNEMPVTSPTVVSTGDIIGVGRVKLRVELENQRGGRSR
ncbi:MAG TPA: FHA domain-containing protein [Chloroflexi bacterium]|nr:FHA domain-containing protein [Chloroflexota bacterium]